jgi:hypothetical protein
LDTNGEGFHVWTGLTGRVRVTHALSADSCVWLDRAFRDWLQPAAVIDRAECTHDSAIANGLRLAWNALVMAVSMLTE